MNEKPTLNIVLVEPRIPQNTGNVARTCACTACRLHLVGPMGFAIDDKKLKHAGLDYWHMMEMRIHDSWDDFLAAYPGAQLFFTSKKARHSYCEVDYPEDAFFVFGRESRGLPEELLREHYESCVRIPMREGLRSLNLSNAAAVAVYEALRQQGYCGLGGCAGA